MQRDLVTVERFYTDHADPLQLKLVAGAGGLKRFIREPTVNRPGLALAGFTKYFANKRVQVMGNAECHFLKSLSEEEREARYRQLLTYKIPCLVFSRGYHPDKVLLRIAEEKDVPVFKCPLITMKFI
ncbi:MAG TPA: HPr(Ser) kinase/phosphatase, partial [Candidatus Limnocylindria bacterium]|nr:HPr(Ser) kinase/phosphatase [Candidatus Limnocylindria bacterium]